MATNKMKQEFENRSLTGVVYNFLSYPEMHQWLYSVFEMDMKHRVHVSGNFCHVDMSGSSALEDHSRLLRDNKAYLLETLGKQDFTILDSQNRRCYCWKVSCADGCFWIITAPERGTSIEVDMEYCDRQVFMNEFTSKVVDIFGLEHLPRTVGDSLTSTEKRDVIRPGMLAAGIALGVVCGVLLWL